eukprot:COSAG01_NODE_749_length_13846_cov_205.366097_10_plen_46_part_00
MMALRVRARGGGEGSESAEATRATCGGAGRHCGHQSVKQDARCCG